MTSEQIIEACEKYNKLLESYNIEVRRENDFAGSLAHIRWMCKETIEFVKAGKLDKAFRWLGFIQGVLWSTETYNLEQLKDDNR